MKINISPLQQWFSFTRSERQASLTLIILIAIVICIRFLIPSSKASVNYITIEQESIKPDTLKSHLTEPAVAVGNTQGRTVAKRLIELNSCDSVELLPLPGIGQVLSARIIRYRNLLGGYASKEQLLEVYGLKPETFNMIKSMVTVDTALIDKINVNSADFRRFGKLPYFERTEINGLLRYRNVNGTVNNIGELVENNILSGDKAAKVKPYLDFSH